MQLTDDMILNLIVQACGTPRALDEGVDLIESGLMDSLARITLFEGLEDLGNAVAALFPAGDPGEAGSLLTDRRQEDAARRALDAVRRALEALETGMTPDAVLTDAEEALDALGELTGRTAKEEIVSRIFSRFCVGK